MVRYEPKGTNPVVLVQAVRDAAYEVPLKTGDPRSGEPGDDPVTIRERDSMSQIRVPGSELGLIFQELLAGQLWSEVASRYPAQGNS